VGGGGSVGFAIQCGVLAIVSNMVSDISPFIGMENCVDGGNKGLVNYIVKISKDKGLYDLKLKSMQRYIFDEQFTVSNYVDIIEKAYSDIISEKKEFEGERL
jgi:hypothetical protein